MSEYSSIVRQLKLRYPDVYNDIMGFIKPSEKAYLDQILDKFCSIKQCTKEQVTRNEDGLRTLFVAVIIKIVDPEGVIGELKIKKNLLRDVAESINVSHIMVRQVACNVKGLLRAHKPFIREVDRIIEEVKQYGNEERE